MIGDVTSLFTRTASVLLVVVAASSAAAQEGANVVDKLVLPGLNSYAPPSIRGPLGQSAEGELTLSAHLTEDGPAISRGLIWRIFKPETDTDGRLPLVATAQGGTGIFTLEPGSYLVHASFGRAGATKRITVGPDRKRESVVLDAGGVKLDAVLAGDLRIPPDKLRFSIYEEEADAGGERALVIPNVKPNTVVRLNSGTYHVISEYGSINAVIRSDIHVEAGKMTEATVEHRAAELLVKLVRERGGEAMADTEWSILTGSGDILRERVSVGPFASMVLAEGEYVVVAKNRDRIYHHELTVVAGQGRIPVEVVTTEAEIDVGVDAD